MAKIEDILLLEDDVSIALIVETVLTAAGHTVRHVTDGTAALDAAKTRAPTLLIADLNLPGDHSGMDVAVILRASHNHLPVVLVSGDYASDTPSPPEVPRAACLAKPFRRAALLDAVAKATIHQGTHLA